MTDDSGVDRNYVRHYVEKAQSTDNEDAKNNYLYRAGTQMELDAITCDGNDKLTPSQQQAVLDAAEKLLGGGDAP